MRIDKARLQADAWIGDAILLLWARLHILRADGRLDGPKSIRMTSNQFLSAFGEPTAVEAEIGRIYLRDGERAALDWIESNIAPFFAKQEENRFRRGRTE